MRKSLPRWIALALCCALLAGCAAEIESAGTQTAEPAGTPTIIATTPNPTPEPTPNPTPAPPPIEPAAYFEERPLFWRNGEAEGWDLDGDALADRVVFEGFDADTPVAVTTMAFGDGRTWRHETEWPGLSTVASADFDGDGARELALLYDTGGNGGAGQFELHLLHVDRDGYAEMALPRFDDWPFYIDAGAARRDGWMIETYQGTLDGSCGGTTQTLALLPEAHEFAYDARGAYKGGYSDLLGQADCAYRIRVVPVLGEYALECRQYVSGIDGGHADGLGDAVTQLLWRDGEYHIIGQWFEPYAFAEEEAGFSLSEAVSLREGTVSLDGGWTTGMRLVFLEGQEGSWSLNAEVLGEGGKVIYTIRGQDMYRYLNRYALADLDGDGTPELIALFDSGGNGGKGSHGLVILTYKKGRVASVDVPGGGEYTGAGGVSFLPGAGFTARLHNKHTGFDGAIYLPSIAGEERASSPRYAFREDGQPKYKNDVSYSDSVYDFDVVSYGGRCALRTRQYMWHGTHINGFADWVSTVILREGKWAVATEHLEWYVYNDYERSMTSD